jgi:CRP/FNR family transcriptional regulator, cyclic AMP receptor protein
MTAPDTAETDTDRGFLGHLHADDLATVLEHTQSRLYRAGEHAIREGELDRSVFIVSRGSFEVVVHGAGRMRLLERGHLFGEVAFFDGRPRTADVVAFEDAEALIMTPAAFERFRLACPRLALYFVLDLGRVLSERLRPYVGGQRA